MMQVQQKVLLQQLLPELAQETQWKVVRKQASSLFCESQLTT
jgi:hypothetical protein